MCLLAGVLCSNDWLKRITLDGNPLDEQGLGYLCRALLRNKSVEFVSLRRCGLGESAGALLLRLMAEKPGLEVECGGGNPFGEDVCKQVWTRDVGTFVFCAYKGYGASGGGYEQTWVRFTNRARQGTQVHLQKHSYFIFSLKK